MPGLFETEAQQKQFATVGGRYRLELATGEIDRTTWWKDENRKEPANMWWLYGPSESRPATVAEIDLWLQLHAAKELQCLGA